MNLGKQSDCSSSCNVHMQIFFSEGSNYLHLPLQSLAWQFVYLKFSSKYSQIATFI